VHGDVLVESGSGWTRPLLGFVLGLGGRFVAHRKETSPQMESRNVVRLAELCACYTAWNARQSPRERRPRCVIDKVELTPRDARDDRVGARAWYESTTLHAGLYNGTFDHLRLEDDQHWTWRTLRLVLLAPMFVSRTLYCCLTSKVLFMSTTASVDPIGPRLMTRYPTTRSTKYCSFEHREH
jgi:hypothetical protein